MPKSSPIQTNFSGGELGPNVEARVDAEKHSTGLETCLNYIPTLEGPLVRTPGSKRVASVKDPSKPPRFVPFKFSNTEQYIIEMGENYIRFFTDEGQVVTSGSCNIITSGIYVFAGAYSVLPQQEGFFTGSRSKGPFDTGAFKTNEVNAIGVGGGNKVNFSSVVSGSILEIPTKYDYNMIQNVGFSQKGDTLWLTHSSMPTFTLQRFTPQDWDLKYFPTSDGPYQLLKSYRTDGDSLNVDLNVINFDAGQAKQTAVAVRTHSTVLIATVLNNGGAAEVRTSSPHGRNAGDRVWIQGVFGTTEINNGSSFVGAGLGTPNANDSSVWQVQVISSTSLLLINSVFSNVYAGSGIVYPAMFNQSDAGRNIGLYIGGQRYFGFIATGSNILGNQTHSLIHPIQVEVGLDYSSPGIPIASTIASVWQLGAHNKVNGYPSVAAFHQSRLFMAGIPGRPTEFIGSVSNQYNNFAVNQASSLVVLDTNALQFNLVSESNDIIQWIKPAKQGLYMGSQSVEFLISPSRDGQALTPTNLNNDIVGNYGSANINPARFGDSVIYVQNSQRKIRELRFFANLQSHRSTQINQISDHIALPQISGLASQKESLPLVWGYRTDGVLISMSYARDDSQMISGWAQHSLGGRSDPAGSPPKIKAIEVIRDSTGKYDQIWMAVQRYINGTSDVIVEYMVEPYRHKDPAQKQRDAFYLSCGATYDSSLVIANITTGSALVTINNHGLSRNDLVLIDDVIGMNSSLINVNNVIVNSNIVNGKVFVVGSTTTNNFFLQDFNSSIIVTTTYSPYFSGGKARKLVSSIGGLTWLKNEEVDVLGDGGIQGKFTVNSAGVIVLTTPVAVAQIGYSYKSRGKTLMLDKGSATGSAIGQQRKTYQAAFRLKDAGDFSYGGIGFDQLHQANFASGDQQQADSAAPLFTGIYRDGLEQDIEFNGQVYFEQSSPLPGMIQSITYLMDEYDL